MTDQRTDLDALMARVAELAHDEMDTRQDHAGDDDAEEHRRAHVAQVLTQLLDRPGEFRYRVRTVSGPELP